MDTKERNQWYWKSLEKFECLRTYLHNVVNWYSLPWVTRDLIDKLADAWNVEYNKHNGWTRAQTLWTRAIKGRPF